MRFLQAAFISLSVLVVSACGGQSPANNPAGPTPVGPSTTLAGTWNGSVTDSSGSMMGSGMSAGMMGQMTWQIRQTGNTFEGTMQFPGYPGHGAMKIFGTITGSTVTFTMRVESGMMSGMMGSCTATATGSLDINELMSQMHGNYSGANSCTGPFDRGHMTLSR